MSATVIVGGGLAGGYAAALLARSGARPIVLERTTGPSDKVCTASSLSAEAQGYLRAAGLDLAVLERAGDRQGACRRTASGSPRRGCRSPRWACHADGWTRRCCATPETLAARMCGAGSTVKRLDGEGLETSDGAMEADRIILASGKHEVRGAGRRVERRRLGHGGLQDLLPARPGAAARRARGSAVEIVMFDGGYAGLQTGGGRPRQPAALLVREAHFATVGRTWPELYTRLMEEPHLARRFAGAEPSEPRPLAVARLPFGFLRRDSVGPRVYPVGDQAAVIPSLTGDGMAIALHSARLAAQAAADGAAPDRYLARLSADLARPIGLATWLQRRAETWPGRAATVAAFAAFPPLMAHIARACTPRAGAGRWRGRPEPAHRAPWRDPSIRICAAEWGQYRTMSTASASAALRPAEHVSFESRLYRASPLGAMATSALIFALGVAGLLLVATLAGDPLVGPRGVALDRLVPGLVSPLLLATALGLRRFIDVKQRAEAPAFAAVLSAT